MSSSWTRERVARTDGEVTPEGGPLGGAMFGGGPLGDATRGDGPACGPATGRSRRHGQGRGQTSPVAALAALFAVCAGLSLYASVLGGSIPVVDGGDVAGPTLDRVHDAAADGGVTDPGRLREAKSRGPNDRRLNVSLTVDGETWAVGPPAPSDARDRASRLVGVRLAPGDVEPGRLSVVVWS